MLVFCLDMTDTMIILNMDILLKNYLMINSTNAI